MVLLGAANSRHARRHTLGECSFTASSYVAHTSEWAKCFTTMSNCNCYSRAPARHKCANLPGTPAAGRHCAVLGLSSLTQQVIPTDATDVLFIPCVQALKWARTAAHTLPHRVSSADVQLIFAALQFPPELTGSKLLILRPLPGYVQP